MAGGRWAEESKQETPYDGGEDEGVKDGIRSYLVVSMLAYEKSKRIWEKEKGREIKWKKERESERRLSLREEYRGEERREIESQKEKREREPFYLDSHERSCAGARVKAKASKVRINLMKWNGKPDRRGSGLKGDRSGGTARTLRKEWRRGARRWRR